jgi:hypothetical protein
MANYPKKTTTKTTNNRKWETHRNLFNPELNVRYTEYTYLNNGYLFRIHHVIGSRLYAISAQNGNEITHLNPTKTLVAAKEKVARADMYGR